MILIIIGLLLYYQFLSKTYFFRTSYIWRENCFSRNNMKYRTPMYTTTICRHFQTHVIPFACQKTYPPEPKKHITFANQEIIVFRGNSRKIQVIPKYCQHMGVDLTHGCVKENTIKYLGECGIQYDNIHLDVENTDNHPKFHYITPYFGFIENVNNARVYIYFFQEKVGKMKMVILPCWNTGVFVVH